MARARVRMVLGHREGSRPRRMSRVVRRGRIRGLKTVLKVRGSPGMGRVMMMPGWRESKDARWYVPVRVIKGLYVDIDRRSFRRKIRIPSDAAEIVFR